MAGTTADKPQTQSTPPETNEDIQARLDRIDRNVKQIHDKLEKNSDSRLAIAGVFGLAGAKVGSIYYLWRSIAKQVKGTEADFGHTLQGYGVSDIFKAEYWKKVGSTIGNIRKEFGSDETKKNTTSAFLIGGLLGFFAFAIVGWAFGRPISRFLKKTFGGEEKKEPQPEAKIAQPVKAQASSHREQAEAITQEPEQATNSVWRDKAKSLTQQSLIGGGELSYH